MGPHLRGRPFCVGGGKVPRRAQDWRCNVPCRCVRATRIEAAAAGHGSTQAFEGAGREGPGPHDICRVRPPKSCVRQCHVGPVPPWPVKDPRGGGLAWLAPRAVAWLSARGHRCAVRRCTGWRRGWQALPPNDAAGEGMGGAAVPRGGAASEHAEGPVPIRHGPFAIGSGKGSG